MTIPKCDFVEVEKRCFKGPHGTFNHRLLDLPKSEMGEFNKASFLVVVRHCEHIFWLLIYPNFDLVEVEKAMNEDVEWHFKIIFAS